MQTIPLLHERKKEKSIYIIFYISFLFLIILMLFTILSLAIYFILNPETPEITLLVINCTVWTGIQEKNGSYQMAEAFAVSKNKIIQVGTNEEILKLKTSPSTKIINGNQQYFVTPGFVDTHVHLIIGGKFLSGPQLQDVSSKEEFIQILKEYIENKAKKGQWVMSVYDHTSWGGELPNKDWIDSISPDNPVFLDDDGHMSLANSIALKLANITKYTKDPPGGTIYRDSDGNPTGLLLDRAMELVSNIIPKDDNETEDESLQLAQEYMLSQGFTGVHCMGGYYNVHDTIAFEIFQRANKTNKLNMRVYASLPITEWKRLSEIIKEQGRGGNEYGLLKIGLLKGFMDGSLGPMSAKMFEPYNNTNHTGLWQTHPEEMYSLIKLADEENLQIAIHAIGDLANHELLNIYEKVLNENGKKDRRWRVEHAQMVIPEDRKRFEQVGAIASMQPIHLMYEAEWAEELIGKRQENLWPWKSLSNYTTITFGSDWYICPSTPIIGIYEAITRFAEKYPNGFFPEENLSIHEALKAYTYGAHYAAFMENELGLIKKGYLADFTIMDRDITSIPIEEIKKTKIIMTIVNGEVKYKNKFYP